MDDSDDNGQLPEGALRPTGWRMLLGLALVSGVVSYLVVDVTYGSLPVLPWTAIPTLLVLAVGEGAAAVHTRRRIRRVPGTEPVEPLLVARLVALAKASSIFAALAVGVFGGMAAALPERLAAPTAQADAITALGTAGAAVVLLVVALLLEYACRVPPQDGDGTNGTNGTDRPGGGGTR